MNSFSFCRMIAMASFALPVVCMASAEPSRGGGHEGRKLRGFSQPAPPPAPPTPPLKNQIFQKYPGDETELKCEYIALTTALCSCNDEPDQMHEDACMTVLSANCGPVHNGEALCDVDPPTQAETDVSIAFEAKEGGEQHLHCTQVSKYFALCNCHHEPDQANEDACLAVLSANCSNWHGGTNYLCETEGR